MNQETKKKQQEFAAKTADNLKRFLEEPKCEREKRIQDVCRRCRYVYGYWNNNIFKMRWCNWDAFHAGRTRPCAGRDCVSKGIFRPADSSNRETVMNHINRGTYAEREKKERDRIHEND